MSEKDNEYLSPKEWARKAFEEGELYVIAWDSNKYRLSQRINALMQLGYQPHGHPFPHTVYEDMEGSGHRFPRKQDACQVMVHPHMIQKLVKGLYGQDQVEDTNISGS